MKRFFSILASCLIVVNGALAQDNGDEGQASDSLSSDSATITMVAAIAHESDYNINRFPGQGVWQDFTGNLLGKIMVGQHPAYDVETLDTLSREDLERVFGLGDDTLRFEDPNTGVEREIVQPREGIDMENVNYVFIEKWTLDTANFKMSKEVIGFIPYVTYDTEIDPSLQNYVTEFLFIAFFGPKPEDMGELEGVIEYERKLDQDY
jgi:hypothetical protein